MFFTSILDVEGNIFSLDGEQRLSYFNAYEFQVSLLYQLKQHNILVSVGVCFAKFLPPPTSPLTPADKNIRIVGTSFQMHCAHGNKVTKDSSYKQEAWFSEPMKGYSIISNCPVLRFLLYLVSSYI